jgi:lysophospholipase L1-like esterase
MVTTSSSSFVVSRRKRVVFALVAMLAPCLVVGGTLLAVDVRLHSKYQTSAGFNIWGYRGPVAGRKQPGEYRVAVLGGSAAYGYGVTWDQAIPALLEQRLAAVAPPGRTFRVINLAYNNEGAYSFAVTQRDYAYLNSDLVFLYEGYNDLMGDPRAPNVSVFRHESPVFRLTGYLPIFPIVFKEKAAAMLSGGDVGALYRLQGKTVFRPDIATQAAAGMLRATAEIGQSLERQLGRATPEAPHRMDAGNATGCKPPWEQYCQAVGDGVRTALADNRQVLVASQPYEIGEFLHARHVEQQQEAAAMLSRRFGGDPRVRYINLGDTIDLGDPAMSFDRMHLTVAGNQRLVEHLVRPVLEMASRRVAAASPQH